MEEEALPPSKDCYSQNYLIFDMTQLQKQTNPAPPSQSFLMTKEQADKDKETEAQAPH